MSISRRSIFQRLKAKGHSIKDEDFIDHVRDFLMEEFGRTDNDSKEALHGIARKLKDKVSDMMKGPKGSRSRTGIERVLESGRHTVHNFHIFTWVLIFHSRIYRFISILRLLLHLFRNQNVVPEPLGSPLRTREGLASTLKLGKSRRTSPPMTFKPSLGLQLWQPKTRDLVILDMSWTVWLMIQWICLSN